MEQSSVISIVMEYVMVSFYTKHAKWYVLDVYKIMVRNPRLLSHLADSYLCPTYMKCIKLLRRIFRCRTKRKGRKTVTRAPGPTVRMTVVLKAKLLYSHWNYLCLQCRPKSFCPVFVTGLGQSKALPDS